MYMAICQLKIIVKMAMKYFLLHYIFIVVVFAQ